MRQTDKQAADQWLGRVWTEAWLNKPILRFWGSFWLENANTWYSILLGGGLLWLSRCLRVRSGQGGPQAGSLPRTGFSVSNVTCWSSRRLRRPPRGWPRTFSLFFTKYGMPHSLKMNRARSTSLVVLLLKAASWSQKVRSSSSLWLLSCGGASTAVFSSTRAAAGVDFRREGAQRSGLLLRPQHARLYLGALTHVARDRGSNATTTGAIT